jgi:hypothetical protein
MVIGQFGFLAEALSVAGIETPGRRDRGATNLAGPEAVLDAIRQ